MIGECVEVRRRLTWFVGGELDREQAAELARHLAGCLPCRREASSLQQAHKALAAAGAASMGGDGVPGVDDAMFAAMRAEIAAATGDAAGAAPRRPRGLWLLAAALLFGLGWWLARAPEETSLLDRAPIPLSYPLGDGLTVAPWAGPRARLQPLGFDAEPDAVDAAEPRLGSGMMRRYRLRTLEDELLAPRAPRKD